MMETMYLGPLMWRRCGRFTISPIEPFTHRPRRHHTKRPCLWWRGSFNLLYSNVMPVHRQKLFTDADHDIIAI